MPTVPNVACPVTEGPSRITNSPTKPLSPGSPTDEKAVAKEDANWRFDPDAAVLFEKAGMALAFVQHADHKKRAIPVLRRGRHHSTAQSLLTPLKYWRQYKLMWATEEWATKLLTSLLHQRHQRPVQNTGDSQGSRPWAASRGSTAARESGMAGEAQYAFHLEQHPRPG